MVSSVQFWIIIFLNVHFNTVGLSIIICVCGVLICNCDHYRSKNTAVIDHSY